tara:strand:- start:39923 stop:40489 length:567 start_codon:yes stop_codon:yes gene_type:complete
MYKLDKDYSDNGISLKAGKYTEKKLIDLYGSKEKFNFCLKCTSLKNVLEIDKPITDNRVDKREIHNKADLVGCVTKDEGILAPPITIDTEKELEVKGTLGNNDLILEPIVDSKVFEDGLENLIQPINPDIEKAIEELAVELPVEKIIKEEEKPELTLEDYQKIAKEKGLKHSHLMGIEKLKKLIKDSE